MNNTKNNSYHNHVYYRIALSTAILYMHLHNVLQLNKRMEEVLPNHPELQVFVDIGPRYATMWNLIFQIVYTLLALVCDLSIVLGKESTISESWRKLRYTFFYGLVFPVGISMGLIFWPYYIYDRELIFPTHADLMITFYQNVMCHGVVSLYAILELAFVPRDSRKYVNNPLKYVILFNITYVATMLWTRYVDKGIWPYNILTVTEGSMFLYVVLIHPPLTTLICYFTQWRIQDAIWMLRGKLPEKN